MKIIEQLKNFGLFDSEIKAYLFLLDNGISTPPQIAKGTQSERSNTYAILSRLAQRGLIEEKQQHNKKVFLAKDPVAFVKILEEQTQSMKSIVDDLRARNGATKNKPSIHFYNGWKQIQQVFLDCYEAKEIIYGMASTKKLFAYDTTNFFETWADGLKERNIFLQDILSHDSSEDEREKVTKRLKGLLDVQILSKEDGELSTDILIWNDKIAFINLEKPMFATVMTNPAIAKTMTLLHKLATKELKSSNT